MYARMPLQIIMELQSGSDAEAVDLSGDAGVVGRWLVQGSPDSPELLMDLKGCPAFRHACTLLSSGVCAKSFAH